MGLSINYSGGFNPEASLQELIDEVIDIAKVYKWEYNIYETAFPEQHVGSDYNDKIYGISFTPPGCEFLFYFVVFHQLSFPLQ